MKLHFGSILFASFAAVATAQPATKPADLWTVRFDWKHTYLEIGAENAGPPKSLPESTDPFSVGYVLDPATLDGGLGLLRPRSGLGLPPTAFRVELAQHRVIGLGANAEAGYAPDSPWPATTVMARAADGSFRIEWDTAKMELQAVSSSAEASRTLIPLHHGDLKAGESLPKGAVPLCFPSTDGSHLLVNTLLPGTASEVPWRTACLLRRSSSTKGNLGPQFEPVSKEPFDTAVWKYFCDNTGLADAKVGPADINGQRQRGIYLMHWTEYKPEFMLFVLAKVERTEADAARSVPGAAAQYYMGLVEYDAKEERFERIIVKQGNPGNLRQPWPEKKAVGATDPPPNVVEGNFSNYFSNISSDVLAQRMSEMEGNYDRLLKILPPEESSNLDTEQRQWMDMRPTLALTETLREWSLFPCSSWAHGLFGAIDARSAELEDRITRSGKALSNQKITDPSPDGRYALRQTYDLRDSKQEGRPLKVEFIDDATKEALLVLVDADEEPMNYNVTMLWSPDSSAFAFHSSARRESFIEVAKKIGNEFVPLPFPSKVKGRGKNAITYNFGRSSENEAPGRIEKNAPAYAYSVSDAQPKRWLKNGELEVDAGSHREITNKNGSSYTMDYLCTLTLAIDPKQRKLVVKSVSNEKQEAR